MFDRVYNVLDNHSDVLWLYLADRCCSHAERWIERNVSSVICICLFTFVSLWQCFLISVSSLSLSLVVIQQVGVGPLPSPAGPTWSLSRCQWWWTVCLLFCWKPVWWWEHLMTNWGRSTRYLHLEAKHMLQRSQFDPAWHVMPLSSMFPACITAVSIR